jgi:hypothetical protein
MTRRHKKLFNVTFLAIFLFLSLAIHFFHTEHCVHTGNSCPACHFQNSTLTTAQISFFHLPQLAMLEMLKVFESSVAHQAFIITPSSRSPPQI